MSRAILSISEDDYKKLLQANVLTEIKHSVKILPNDLPLQNDEHYKLLKKNYRKAMDDLNKYAFDKLVNR